MYSVPAITVTINRHHDGCVILEGSLEGPCEELQLYERYHTGARTPAILRALAKFVDRYERGISEGDDLWDQLQLPLDKHGAERYTEDR